jgi:hypothetical protein
VQKKTFKNILKTILYYQIVKHAKIAPPVKAELAIKRHYRPEKARIAN